VSVKQPIKYNTLFDKEIELMVKAHYVQRVKAIQRWMAIFPQEIGYTRRIIGKSP
jgi:ribosomal protein S19